MPFASIAMRWLMIAFLVSLGALLVAAAGLARHILLHRARLRSNSDAGGPAHVPNVPFDPVDEVDRET